MKELLSVKNVREDDNFTVEYEVFPATEVYEDSDPRRKIIYEELRDVDQRMAVIQDKIDELNSEIDRLTSHADGIDYMVAAASGVLTGVIDIVFVGKLSLETANEWGTARVNSFVTKVAQQQGYSGNDLNGAVRYLEKNYKIAADSVTSEFGGGKQHHLRDFSHHPTPVGLLFSILTQFTGKVYGTDVHGIFQGVSLGTDGMELIGNNFPQKITYGVIHWFFHMVSDMAGSFGSLSGGSVGTGLPGPIVSMLKEISSLPLFKNMNTKGNKEFSVWISKLFNGTLLGERDVNGNLVPLKFDLRTEIGVAHQLKKQAIPVIINECIVRGFYFIRRLYMEIKNLNIQKPADLKNINWKNTLPIKNRTVARMLTIATGTFTAIDLTEATVHSAVESGGVASPLFLENMLLRINFVGIGRFVVAFSTDIAMGVERNKLRNERMALYQEQIFLKDTKVFYKQADMWISAENTGKTIGQALEMMEKAKKYFTQAIIDISTELEEISGYLPGIIENNPGLIDDIEYMLEWG